MTIDELNDKIKRMRVVTDAKLKYLRDHSKLLDQAFEELKEVDDEELHLIYNKIRELDERMSRNGLH